MVKLVLYIQPIPREQWEQIWASALLKGWRINLMCMFWWWWGKPDYLEETVHTKRPQWDGKLGPSCCWPLCYFEKQIFSNTHKSHFYCVSIQFLLLSSSSSSSSTSLRGETAHQSCDMFAASELIQISHHQVFLSPSTIIFFFIKASWYDGNTTIVCGKDEQDFYFWKQRWLKETDITL